MTGIWSVSYQRWSAEDCEIGDTDDKGFVCENVRLSDALEALGVTFPRGKPVTPYLIAPSDGVITAPEYNAETHDYYTTGVMEERSLIAPTTISKLAYDRLRTLLGL